MKFLGVLDLEEGQWLNFFGGLATLRLAFLKDFKKNKCKVNGYG